MIDYQFPVTFEFKIGTIHNDFRVKDANGSIRAYVKQKLFKFKEDIQIFTDEYQREVLYTIKADRWLDFSAFYTFYDFQGNAIGKVGRKGWRSIWKAHYEIFNGQGESRFHINEENGWVKVMDSLVGEIPIVNFFTGYLFNPSYLVTDNHNQKVARIKKEPSFWGKKFTIEKLSQLEGHSDDNIVLGLMMMVLLERRRG